MTITIDIPDQFVASIEQYLLTQKYMYRDEVTGLPAFRSPYSSPEDWIVKSIGAQMDGILAQFPTPERTARMIEKKRIEDDLKSSSMPILVSVKKA